MNRPRIFYGWWLSGLARPHNGRVCRAPSFTGMAVWAPVLKGHLLERYPGRRLLWP